MIAHAGQTRSRLFPDIPTIIEQGFDVSFESWQGLLAPRGTPRDLVAQLQGALQKALRSTDFRKDLERIGAEPIDELPTAFEAFLRNELEKYRGLAERGK